MLTPEQRATIERIQLLATKWLQNFKDYELATEPDMQVQFASMKKTYLDAKTVLEQNPLPITASQPVRVGAGNKKPPTIEITAPKGIEAITDANNFTVTAIVKGLEGGKLNVWHNDIEITSFSLAGTNFTCNLTLVPLDNSIKLKATNKNETAEAACNIIKPISNFAASTDKLNILHQNITQARTIVPILNMIPDGTTFPSLISDLKIDPFKDTAKLQELKNLIPDTLTDAHAKAGKNYCVAYEGLKNQLGVSNLQNIQVILDSNNKDLQMKYLGNDWSAYANILLTNSEYESLKKKIEIYPLENLISSGKMMSIELRDRKIEANKKVNTATQTKIQELAANKGKTPDDVVNAFNKFLEQRNTIGEIYTVLSNMMAKQNVACITPTTLEEMQKNWITYSAHQKNWVEWKKIISEKMSVLATPLPSKKDKNPKPLFSLDNAQESDLAAWGAYAKFYCTDFKPYIKQFDEGFNKLSQVYQGLLSGQKNANGQKIESYMPENNLSGNFQPQAYTSKDSILAVDIEAADIDQGNLGNCYYMASIATLANTMPEAFLEGDNAIIKQEGEGANVQYIVTLQLPCADGKRQATKIVVKPEFLTKKGTEKSIIDTSDTSGGRTVAGESKEESLDVTPFAQPHLDTTKDGKKVQEIWVMVLEKALAQAKGSYEAVGGTLAGNNSQEAMAMLLGDTYKTEKISLSGKSVEELKTEFLKNQIKANEKKVAAVFGSNDKINGKSANNDRVPLLNKNGKILHISHAYSLENWDGTSLTLRNPHGISKDKEGNEISPALVILTLDEVIADFSYMEITVKK